MNSESILKEEAKTLVSSKKRFMGWRDLALTPMVSLAILTISFLCTFAIHQFFGFSFFLNALIFYILMLTWTLVTLKIIRVLFPIREGIFSYRTHPLTCYIWNLHTFLCIIHLGLFYTNCLIPVPLRKFFYLLLGAKMGKGILSIGGRLVDPSLIRIEENVIIGDDSLLAPHVYAAAGSDTLILAKIEIKRGAIIGAKSMIMPGVTVGENSMVNAMSLVAMNTKIPANEIWGGNPAKRIGEIPRPNEAAGLETMKVEDEAGILPKG